MKKTFTLVCGLMFSMLKAQCPDLKITHGAVLELHTHSIRYALNIANIGDLHTRLDGPTSSLADNVVIESYLSYDIIWDAADLKLQNMTLGIAPLTTIKAGEVYSIVHRDSLATAGYQYLIVKIDATNQINECAELNNVFIIEIQQTPLTLEAPSLVGYKGQQIEIPIYASDFNAILGFQFSISFSKPTLFKIDSVGSLGLAELIRSDIRIKSNNAIGVVWLSSLSEGLTFRGKKKLFSIYVTLTGDHGDCTAIQFDHSFLPIEFISTFPLTEPIRIETISGKLCMHNLVECSGRVTLSNLSPINKVTVKANHLVTTTNTSGRYTFKDLDPGLNYTVSADKSDAYASGLSVMDILMIKKHLLQILLLPSPYEIIAADVNGDLTISVQDIVLIRSLILGLIPDFGKTPVWQFIPKEYKFRNPLNPLAENYPISYSLENLKTNKINVDFIGIKTGDVNLDWLDPNAQPLESRLSSDYYKLKLPSQKLVANADYIIPVLADQISTLAGLQFALKMDASISISKIVAPALKGFSTQHYALDGQYLKMLWHAAYAELSSGEAISDTLFLIHVHTRKEINSADLFTIKSQIIEPLVINHEEKKLNITIESRPTAVVSQSKHLLLDVQAWPNPVTTLLNVQFNNPLSGNVKLHIVDQHGRLLFQQQSDLAKGLQEFKLDTHTWSAGLYHVRISSGQYQQSKSILCTH